MKINYEQLLVIILVIILLSFSFCAGRLSGLTQFKDLLHAKNEHIQAQSNFIGYLDNEFNIVPSTHKYLFK